MAKTKFTYKMIVTKFNNADEDKKVDILKSHIVKQYVDYQTKLSDIRTIVQIGNYVTIPDPANSEVEREIFKRNTPVMYYLLKLRLIANYTDIEIKDGEELEAYNALEEIDVLDKLISLIPENEIVKWNTMLQMVNDDVYMNERDLPSYLDTKLNATGMVLDTLLSSLGEFTNKLESMQDEN